MKTKILVTSILIFGIIAGCKKKDTTSPTLVTSPTNEVFMQNTSFNPGTITVAINATVKWTNKDGFAHTVTSTTGIFDSGNINSGGTFSHQFTSAGTFPYKCLIHSSMTGTVIVQ